MAQARAACLRDYGRCADACEAALGRLGSRPERSDLVVCAAVCRVAHRALADGLAAAHAIVQYSVEVSRRCAETLEALGDPGLAEASRSAASAAESAATLLLAS